MRIFLTVVAGVVFGLPLMLLRNHLDLESGKTKRYKGWEWMPSFFYAMGLTVIGYFAVPYRILSGFVTGDRFYENPDDHLYGCIITGVMIAGLTTILIFTCW